MMFLQTDRPLGKMRVPLSDPPWNRIDEKKRATIESSRGQRGKRETE
jgi:hypothetical protein